MIPKVMTDQIRALLDDRERTLTAAIAALHAELMPMEEELAQIRRAKGALGVPIIGPSSLHAHMTIKQLIVKCLSEHFRSGATSSQLREFIRDAWECDIARVSLSPQLSRLHTEKVIDREGHIWLIK